MAAPGSTGRRTGGLRGLIRGPAAPVPPPAAPSAGPGPARPAARRAARAAPPAGARAEPGAGTGAVAGRPGDDAIVLGLYREYHRPLLGFVLRLTGGDRPWAEDVVQETMIRAWRNVDRLDDRTASLMPWLATVARRIVIDERRYRDARPREVGDGPLENQPMADETDGLLHRVVVAEALNALSPAHRQVLTETVLRDRTVNQAAEVLGIPVGTVKSRVYYALRALRVALEERGVTA